jgi:lipopolysaccharide transport protein LptA
MRIPATVWAAFFLAVMAGVARGQGSAPATLTPRTPAPVKTAAEKSPAEKKEAAKTPATPVVTEIYADEAVFESSKSLGFFTGHVIVTDPRFNIQGDKLTIYLNKKQNEGLEKAIVEGNVGVVRDRPDPEGGPPSRMVGRSDKAVYTPKSGGFELTGNPRVQQGLNIHVATSPDTVMVLNDNGQLQTHGPSRTEIREAPSPSPSPSPTP